MTVSILVGDVFERLRGLPSDSVDCVVTSPPYWGLRSYLPDDHPEKPREIGLERTLGEHLDVLVRLFDEVRRVMKPEATLWLNYGDCYATKPNGRSALATKAAGNDDRTFRDKPFSTVGPIYARESGRDRRGTKSTLKGAPPPDTPGRIMAGGTLKPKDLCLIPQRLAIALQDAGWWVRSEIVWGKPNPMPDSSGRYRPSTAHEKVWLLTKSAKSYYDAEAVRMPATSFGVVSKVAGWASDGDHTAIAHNQGERGAKKRRASANAPRHAGHICHTKLDQTPRGEGRFLRNYEPDLSRIVPPTVWEIATAAFSEAHFATFPPALVVPCILAGCPEGGTVLDPFGGAGTTGLVADRLQRNAILIELNPDSVDIATHRLRDDAGLWADVNVEVAA